MHSDMSHGKHLRVVPGMFMLPSGKARFYHPQHFTLKSTSLFSIVLLQLMYRKVPKFLDTKNFCCKLPKIQTKWQNLRLFCQNGAKGIANSEDPDQTAPLGAVWSGSALFAQTYLSENLGSLQYFIFGPLTTKQL